MARLTDEEYAALAEKYEKEPPALSGKPGYFTRLKEQQLALELLGDDCARFVNAKAKAMSVSPSQVIRAAIRDQLAGTGTA
jgi:hypothetical protein